MVEYIRDLLISTVKSLHDKKKSLLIIIQQAHFFI
jgi:hypothetical protein